LALGLATRSGLATHLGLATHSGLGWLLHKHP
jgi:hypothetical protein